VSDAAHELRSPVASIRQHAEVALAHPDRSSVDALAATVLEENLRVQRLVEDLILLASSDEQPRSADREVDLDDIVFEEARRMRGSTKLTVATSGVSAGRVRGDPGQLRRMVANLVDNAARHATTLISLSLEETGAGSVVLRVDDDGTGIPVADRGRVFERFVRLDEARARDDGGAGLGLAIVAEVAASHGGSATVGDSPSGGARLEVVLPRAS
jgi:signal transduction histidine kinase